MGFTVEQDCPQCGAPIELDETDHLMRCPYCQVKNFLFTPKYFRYLLPHKVNQKEIIYAPYLRFKGNVY
jgi:DNA-directed RNA polymerase subunit RPC12/RpoP